MIKLGHIRGLWVERRLKDVLYLLPTGNNGANAAELFQGDPPLGLFSTDGDSVSGCWHPVEVSDIADVISILSPCEGHFVHNSADTSDAHPVARGLAPFLSSIRS